MVEAVTLIPVHCCRNVRGADTGREALETRITGGRRAVLALAVFAAWASITVFLARLWQGRTAPVALNDSVTAAVQPSYLVAIAFLLLCLLGFGWRDVGLIVPRPLSSLRLLWFPALYVAIFFVGVMAVGLPPLVMIAVIAANTFLVGISEELACRGILYQGLLPRFGIRAAILTSTALFGAVHLLNGFTTGDFGAAAIQSATAFMSGIVFLAIRIRTRSLFPGIILHGLWDCALVTLATAAQGRIDAAEAAAPSIALPLILILPNFLYGLFLLRKSLGAGGRGGEQIPLPPSGAPM